MNAIYTECKDLPESIKSALRSVGYNRTDISIEARDEMSFASPPAFEGSRGFTLVVNLTTGQCQVEHGSWGGANMFERRAVDCDETLYPMRPGIAVIQGESGGRGCFAHLYLHPDNVCKFLPAVPTLTAKQAAVVYVYDSIKSSYRKAELDREGCTTADVDECIALGYLERKGNGVRVTTFGKNARALYKKAR
jgi:hypothetical protein